jgi:hypothetical protein
MSYRLLFDDDETTVAFIKRIFHHAKQTLVDDYIQSALVKLGLACDIGTSPSLPLFDENARHQSPGLLALWERDCPLENLSARRRNMTFCWIHKMMHIRCGARNLGQPGQEGAIHLAT